MDAAACQKILDRVITAFLDRNPDLAKDIHLEAVLYGALTPETLAKIEKRMDEEVA